MQSLRLMFTIEDAKETKEVLEEFLNIYHHGGTPGQREFTKGHFKRGAE